MKKVVLCIIFLMLMVTAAWAKININTASVAELETLPGIGSSNTEAI